jgi:hypothetical protein
VIKFTQLVRRNICGAARNIKLKNVDEPKTVDKQATQKYQVSLNKFK